MIEWAQRYALGRALESRRLPGGQINRNDWLRTERGEWLVRRYPPERTEEEILFELSVLQRLRDQGVPGSVPVRSRDGAICVRDGSGFGVVLTFVRGRAGTLADVGSALAFDAGRMYARVRRALDGFVPDGARRSADVQDLTPTVRALLARARPAEAALVGSAWASVVMRLSRVPPRRLGVVHGDLYYANMILDEDGQLVAFIDYDDAYTGDVLLDLAGLVMESATPEREVVPELARATLAGYAADGGLLPSPELLAAAMVAVHCKFLCLTTKPADARGRIAENDYFTRLSSLVTPGRLELLTDALRVD